MNLLLATDSYKAGHSRLYPPGMTKMYSYLESRGGKFPATVFWGLQYYLQRFLEGQVFNLYDVHDAQLFWTKHFGRDDYFDQEAWYDLHAKYNGKLPIRIKAVKEGTLVPTYNVLMTIENTDPEFPWLVGWLETLLFKAWYPTTVATQSYWIRQAIKEQFERSGSDMAALDFACHDFGYRGVSSEETAALGAAAHLLSFSGTDTVAGILLAQDHYAAGMVGFSIPATEHSVICSFGRENEIGAFRHLLETFPTGLVACVSDTYDLINAVRLTWGEDLHDEVLARDGRLVVRPDSGDPQKNVLFVLASLWDKFGGSFNKATFSLLNDKVRVIQGDGMDYESIGALYKTIVDWDWAAENLVVGSGGGLLQRVDRDTCKFAIKASEVTVNGQTFGIWKSPVTDPGKRSKRGKLKLVARNGTYKTLSSIDHSGMSHNGGPIFANYDDVLETVFEDGEVVRRQTFDEIRALARSQ